jgi:hypothetical protein
MPSKGLSTWPLNNLDVVTFELALQKAFYRSQKMARSKQLGEIDNEYHGI